MRKANFDSEFCGNLPIHHINTIQPHGAIMLLDKDDLRILQISVNLATYLNKELQEIVGASLDSFVRDGVDDIKGVLTQSLSKKITFRLVIEDLPFFALISEHDRYYLLEVQPEQESTKSKFGGLQEVRELVAALNTTSELQEACDLIVKELQSMLGIDGVMMYKFDADWNGTVIAEVKTKTLEPYFGVTFPASDVPRQARELYLKNPIRLIPDGTYTPSRLYPVINPLTNAFTDLSACFLRGVADVHLEYLSNMKVMGSMSLRVIHNGKLWGLIACHHCSTFGLNFEDGVNLALLSNVISTKISSIINNSEYQFVSDLQRDRNLVIDAVYKSGIKEGLFSGEVNLLKLFRASGAVIFEAGQQFVSGETPERAFLDNLYLWLQAKEINQVYSTHNLASVLEEAINYSELASGMLVIPISSTEPDYIVCFRPEVVKTIEWGGNPHQAINFEVGGTTYHPRHSFKIWMETVNQTALPWHEQELQIANTVRSFLLEHKR
ncbi:GAF domain-containing protein [Sphingobacterium bambusae]|uniref:GAF domain-containing protein n=1 Tax=Sphingobacterium bambusae TaxID=662858 RepID=A0ABW6BMY3_9SPHI|nr:GAF domain-containing protein [Sphingobacterium bambusae]WPL49028.1 GAF domain-containing protein [Sphingobacterium bambusae]